MFTIILLVLLGAALFFCGMWISVEYGMRFDSTAASLLAMLVGLAIACAGIAVPLWIGGAFDGPSDPCKHLVSVKPIIYEHYKGWISYGGRPVWCGPGAPH